MIDYDLTGGAKRLSWVQLISTADAGDFSWYNQGVIDRLGENQNPLTWHEDELKLIRGVASVGALQYGWEQVVLSSQSNKLFNLSVRGDLESVSKAILQDHRIHAVPMLLGDSVAAVSINAWKDYFRMKEGNKLAEDFKLITDWGLENGIFARSLPDFLKQDSRVAFMARGQAALSFAMFELVNIISELIPESVDDIQFHYDVLARTIRKTVYPLFAVSFPAIDAFADLLVTEDRKKLQSDVWDVKQDPVDDKPYLIIKGTVLKKVVETFGNFVTIPGLTSCPFTQVKHNGSPILKNLDSLVIEQLRLHYYSRFNEVKPDASAN